MRTKRILGLILGITMMVFGGVGLASAGKPNQPVYATIEQVQQMINDAIAPINTAIDSLTTRLSLVETAVTGNTADIEALKNSQQKPSFEIEPYVVASKNTNAYGTFDKVVADIRATGSNTTGYLPIINYWGNAQTPDGSINALLVYDQTQDRLIFQLPDYYPNETPIEVEIYIEYGGKVGKTTINL